MPLHSCCWCLLQGVQNLSLSTSISQSGSGGSQSSFSNSSYGLRDTAGKENVYAIIGVYKVPASSEEACKLC